MSDFRLMEAIASGALIMVDRMYVPRPYPLIEDHHIVYYGKSLPCDDGIACVQTDTSSEIAVIEASTILFYLLQPLAPSSSPHLSVSSCSRQQQQNRHLR